jgi:uncharacterized protein YkwD
MVAGCMPWETLAPPSRLGAGRAETVSRHNAKRAETGVGALAKDKYVQSQAQYAANRIAWESGGDCVLNHSTELLAWYNAFAGENIGCIWDCIDAKAAVKAFWASPPHRAIMIEPGFHRIGVGIQCIGPMSYFAVHFVA